MSENRRLKRTAALAPAPSPYGGQWKRTLQSYIERERRTHTGIPEKLDATPGSLYFPTDVYYFPFKLMQANFVFKSNGRIRLDV